jgi:hypothetical protein
MPKKLKNKRLVLALVLGGILLGPIVARAQAVTEFRVVIKSLKAEVALSAGPPSLAFGNVNVGQTGTSSITVTNAGGTTADDVQYQVTPSNSGFILNGGCGPSLGPGQSCTESVTFAPTAGQSYEGLFTASGASQSSTVSLSGTGLLAQNQVNAGSLTFASYAVGATSPAQTVTLSNPGNTALSGVNARTSGPYAATSNCTSSLAPNGSCSINVTFTPTVMNSNPGNLFIDSALGTQTLALSGTGLKAIDQFSVTSLAFGNQSVGVASTAKSFTITNPGNINLGISQVTPQGPFAVSSNTCGASLAPNATCTIGVTFTPTAIGNASGGAVNVVTSAGSQAISLSGTGTQARLSASPTSLAFGGVFAGNSSAAQSVTLTNSGNVAATSLVIAAPNGYTQTNTCGTSLAAQSSCNISVTFSPATSGAFNANLTATSSVPTVSVPLSGTGVCSPGFQVFTSNGTFTPRPGCSTNLVLVVGGGGGGAALSFAGGGGGGAGGVGVQFANGLTTAQAITIGGGGAGGARSNGNAGGAGGTSCFAGICAGGGAGAGTNGIGGGGGSGGGRGNGAMSNGGSSGSASSDGSAGGQGNYASFIALFRDVSVTAGAGGAGYASPFTAANDAGGGGGGILLNGGGASGGGGLIGGDSAFPANGGTGYGAGGGGGQWQCQSQCQPGGGGAGAQGVVYVEWSQ